MRFREGPEIIRIFADLSNRKKMDQKEINSLACLRREEGMRVLAESRIAEIWEQAGCRVSIVGSLRMGLLISHRDIDLHVYSSGITAGGSFAIMAKIADNPRVTEIRCINGLGTDEHCIAWHLYYKADDGEMWKFDIIHIEAGSRYDGYFERMADRIVAAMTDEHRDIILRLKSDAEEDCDIHGVEYYEAVIAYGIHSAESLRRWVADHRKKPPYYWIP